MGVPGKHDPALIRAITDHLRVDYSESDGYTFVVEGWPFRGVNMSPDIVVYAGPRIVCAVEIGYTRPEKLTAYTRRFGIADVRWYDKAGCQHFGSKLSSGLMWALGWREEWSRRRDASADLWSLRKQQREMETSAREARIALDTAMGKMRGRMGAEESDFRTALKFLCDLTGHHWHNPTPDTDPRASQIVAPVNSTVV